MEKMTETVTVRLTPHVKAVLKAAAEADKRKLGSFLTLILEERAEQIEKGGKPRGRK